MCLERVEGIDPSSGTWQAPVLPLYYTRVLFLNFLIRSSCACAAGVEKYLFQSYTEKVVSEFILTPGNISFLYLNFFFNLLYIFFITYLFGSPIRNRTEF